MFKLKYLLISLITIIMLLICSIFHIDPVSANFLRWSRVNIPANGPAGNWVLAANSDVRCPTLASDGTLYCFANPVATGFRLFKSSDNGFSWSYTGRVEDNDIIDIAIAPNDPNLIYYATASRIYRSRDAGNSFEPLQAVPGTPGAGNLTITSLDVILADGRCNLVISTCDSAAGRFGGIYTYQEGSSESWFNTGLSNYDVYTVSFSPGFNNDQQIVAVATDEINTVIISFFASSGWNSTIPEAIIPGLVPLSAALAFPDDYDSDPAKGRYRQFIALNTGSNTGDIYCLQTETKGIPPRVTDLNAGAIIGKNQVDIHSLAVTGTSDAVYIMAGASASTDVFFSYNCGQQWSSSIRSPSGGHSTFVIMTHDFQFSGKAFAGTGGSESAFSVSKNRGSTWTQCGLIDTSVAAILDLAISPDYTHNMTLFLLTSNVQDSLWYSSSGGEKWERIYCTTQAAGERIKRIMLSSQYNLNKKVFLAGSINDQPFIWKSNDGGNLFITSQSIDPWTGKPVEIDTWTITSSDTIFVGSYENKRGLVYQTTPDGTTYIDKAQAGSHYLNMLAVSPDYFNDHTILAANASGSVYYSVNNGLIFEPLPLDASQPPLAGNLSIAFDPGFHQNKTVYAASSTPNQGIYRFVIGESLTWESIDRSLPVGGKIGGLAASTCGQIYGLNTQNVDKINKKGGIERSVNSLEKQNPVFETISDGLDEGLCLDQLWIQGNSLWASSKAVNTVRLWNFIDSLTQPVSLTTPVNNSTGLHPHNPVLAWNPSPGVTSYQWQIDTDNNFSNLDKNCEGETDVTTCKLATLEQETTYFWRVRASQPFVSPWSPVWTFTTLNLSPAPTSTIPPSSPEPSPILLAAPRPSEPKYNTAAPLEPVFKWSASENAEGYYLLVSRNDTFTDLVIQRTCYANIWQSNIPLEYNTCYYWKIRAFLGQNQSPWSDVYLFITEPAPSSTPFSLDVPRLSEPRSGIPISITPVFKWTLVDNAERYELQISKTDDFRIPVIDRICNANVWQSDVILEYAVNYYWKVRAIKGEILSQWSSVSVFSTLAKPASPTSSTESGAISQQIIIPSGSNLSNLPTKSSPAAASKVTAVKSTPSITTIPDLKSPEITTSLGSSVTLSANTTPVSSERLTATQPVTNIQTGSSIVLNPVLGEKSPAPVNPNNSAELPLILMIIFTGVLMVMTVVMSLTVARLIKNTRRP